MNKNMITKAIAGSVMVAASMSAVAKVETFSIGFVTIQDLTIDEVSPIAFGQKIIGKAGTACTMDVTADIATTTGALTDVQSGISGAGCIDTAAANGASFAGVYTVSGEADLTVNVTVASVSATDFDFSPSGLLLSDGGDLNNDAVDVFADSSAATTLDSTNGEAHIYLGGTLTVGASDLTANTPYSADYTITATY